MMYKKTTIETLMQKEQELIDKYREYSNVASSENSIALCGELINKHNLHISELEKYLER